MMVITLGGLQSISQDYYEAADIDGASTYQSFRGITIPLLSDFHPKGTVAMAYGVYNEERGTAKRVTFVIDEQGIIRDVQTAEMGSFQSVGALCSALDLA